MIPKRIIQFWHDQELIPDVTLEAIQRTRELHSGYEYLLADDAYMQTHIASHHGKATLDLYNRILIPASRSDLARLMLLHHFGGTYLDCSLQFHKSLDSILQDDDEIVLAKRDDSPRFQNIPDKANVTNSMISAPPASNFIYWCIIKALSNLVDGDYNNKVALATGPQVINMALHRLGEQHRTRSLSFAKLRENSLTLTRKPGITNSWLDVQGEGILEPQYLKANGRRIERLWSFRTSFIHLSVSFLKIKN